MRHRRIGAVLATWIAASLASAARAENRPTQLADHKPNAPPAALELELGYRFYSDNAGSAHFLAPSFAFRYAFTEHAELTLDWPLAFAAFDPKVGSGDSSLKSGDPAAALYYVGHLNNGYYRIGGGVAFPVAHLSPSSGTGALAYAGALAMHGSYDLWRYEPDTLSLILPARIEAHSGALVLGGEGGLIVLIPTSGPGRKTDLDIQLAGWLGGKVDNTTFGARLQLAWLASEHGDNAQLALVPFVQGDFSGGGFVYARLLLNLDTPFGFFGNRSGVFHNVWGFFLGGGSRF